MPFHRQDDGGLGLQLVGMLKELRQRVGRIHVLLPSRSHFQAAAVVRRDVDQVGVVADQVDQGRHGDAGVGDPQQVLDQRVLGDVAQAAIGVVRQRRVGPEGCVHREDDALRAGAGTGVTGEQAG